MLRTFAIAAAAALVFVGIASATPAPEDVSVRVSLAKDDPNVQTAQRAVETNGFVEFFVFVEGQSATGGEFGLTIEGADFIAYVIDTSKPWLAMPLTDPYPGTISQVRAGPACYDPPIYFGRVLVRPHEPNGRVDVRVIPSELQQHAVILGCVANEPTNGFRAYPATLNGDAIEPYMCYGDRIEGIRRNLDASDAPHKPSIPEDSGDDDAAENDDHS
jgi:hypothetical protein